MRGHIRKHGKGWAVIIDEGHQPARHCFSVPPCKRVRIWVQDDPKAETCPQCGGPLGKAIQERRQRWQAFRTKGEAEMGLTEILGKVAHGEYVPPTRVTVAEYLRESWFPYLTDRVAVAKAGGEKGLRETTVAQYKTLAETHIIPKLGGIRLRSLTAAQLDRFYGDLLRSGRKVKPSKPPAGLSPTTVHAVHVTISAALTHAVKKGVLSRNVAKMAEPPGPGEREQAIWTADETARILDSLKDDRLGPLYLLAMATGMRRGELAGLRWEDVDLKGGKLTIAAGPGRRGLQGR